MTIPNGFSDRRRWVLLQGTLRFRSGVKSLRGDWRGGSPMQDGGIDV